MSVLDPPQTTWKMLLVGLGIPGALLAGLWVLSQVVIGCNQLPGFGPSTLIVQLGRPLDHGVVYDVELCLDEECWTSQVEFQDEQEDLGPNMWVTTSGEIERILAEPPGSRRLPMTVSVAADGEEIVKYQGEIVFDVYRPGLLCGIAIYHGTVTI